MSEPDFESSRWKSDVEIYERARLIVSKLREMNSENNLDFWRDRANAIVNKYPSAKLERIV